MPDIGDFAGPTGLLLCDQTLPNFATFAMFGQRWHNLAGERQRETRGDIKIFLPGVDPASR